MHIDFIEILHKKTDRNYLERVIEHDKIECSQVASRYDRQYFDGDRKYGYGGYHYDGRWAPVALNMVKHYGLKEDAKILDIGCAKGYLLYELKKILPNATVCGVDISKYAIENAKSEVKPYLQVAPAHQLPFEDHHFDLIISITTLHNVYIHDLKKAIDEINRVLVSGGNSYVVVESYRNVNEKINLLYWQLTCELLFTPDEWNWIFDTFGYRGDYSFIFFE